MIVPPFMPQPLEIPGNVGDGPYGAIVRFVRGVVWLHMASVLIVVGLSYESIPRMPWPLNGLILIGSLITLSIVRGAVKGRHWEMYASAAILPVTLVALAGIIPSPGYVFAVPAVCASLYVLACGRDLSFIGLGVFTFLGSMLVLAILDGTDTLPPGLAPKVACFYAFTISYLIYDLAMIVRRRRADEGLGAAVDLYRDTLNFVTYPIRVWSHWQKHRIWSLRVALADPGASRLHAIRRIQQEARRKRASQTKNPRV